jgi:hypothetical protein
MQAAEETRFKNWICRRQVISYWFLCLFELAETCSRQVIGGGETGRERSEQGAPKDVRKSIFIQSNADHTVAK